MCSEFILGKLCMKSLENTGKVLHLVEHIMQLFVELCRKVLPCVEYNYTTFFLTDLLAVSYFVFCAQTNVSYILSLLCRSVCLGFF